MWMILACGQNLRQVADDAVVKAGTDADQHVALVHGRIGFVCSVHQHADGFLSVDGNAPEPISVNVTGAPHMAELSQLFQAPFKTTPPPA